MSTLYFSVFYTYEIYIQMKSFIKFRAKLVVKKVLPVLLSRFGLKINFNSINEIIISRSLEKTLSKIDTANTLYGVEKSDNLNFRKFVFENVKYLKEGMPVLWILFLLDCKRDGYFVEFGACDGVLFSNTRLLEMDFGWSGILAEPSKGYSNKISENRSAIIDKRAVWSRTGEFVEFAEVSAGGLSGINATFRENTKGPNKRELLGIKKYMVETVSLNDLLSSNNAPVNFDLLSIDTEGSEFEILKTFNFDKYRPSIILIEFNGSTHFEKSFENTLSDFGYKSIGSKLQDQRNMWFVLNSIPNLDNKI
jgi:FkbM family methyltransferase